jgi:hypothetical protein
LLYLERNEKEKSQRESKLQSLVKSYEEEIRELGKKIGYIIFLFSFNLRVVERVF